MKTKLRDTQSGSAVLVVIVLLGLMAILLVSNSRTLHQLKTNIRLTEQKQLRNAGGDSTNLYLPINK